MSVAHAETQLAAVLLVELMRAIAEEDDCDEDAPTAPVLAVTAAEPLATA